MIPEVKRIIRSVTFDECKSLVRRILRYRTTSEIEREIEEFLKARRRDRTIAGYGEDAQQSADR